MIKQYMTKEKNFISIVAYTRNEENYIFDFLLKIDNFLKEKFETYEFIIVDDASTDKTKEKMKEVSLQINGNLTIVDLAWEHGLEKGILAGIDIAIGDFLIEFDDIFMDYKLEEITNAYYKCLEGFDIVAVSSTEKIKKSSKLFYNYLKKISHRNMTLTTEKFRIVSRRALNRIMKSNEKIRYRKAIYHYSGFNTCMLTYDTIQNRTGKNKEKFSNRVNLGLDIFIGYSDFATKMTINISCLFLVLTLITLLYTVYSFITVDDIQKGWTTTMLFLSISFTGLFTILTILSKYLSNIIIELQDRPRYTFRSIDRLSRK